MLRTLAVFVLLGIGSAAFAQAETPAKPRAERRFDCSQAKDPKACEARVARAREAGAKASQACESKTGAERRDCMRRELCAQSGDPARCEARVKAGEARRARMREACKGKEGEELRSCIREQRRRK
jgi:hypothetical protein